MKNIMNWIEKPITWKSYLKLCGVSLILCMAEMAWMFGYVDKAIEKVKKAIDKNKK